MCVRESGFFFLSERAREKPYFLYAVLLPLNYHTFFMKDMLNEHEKKRKNLETQVICFQKKQNKNRNRQDLYQQTSANEIKTIFIKLHNSVV